MTAPAQHDEAWLATATPEQIDQAYRAGELAQLLTGPPAAPAADPARAAAAYQAGQLATVAGMLPEQIDQAYREGKLAYLLGQPINHIAPAALPPAGQ
jgi:hypothetical protein